MQTFYSNANFLLFWAKILEGKTLSGEGTFLLPVSKKANHFIAVNMTVIVMIVEYILVLFFKA